MIGSSGARLRVVLSHLNTCSAGSQRDREIRPTPVSTMSSPLTTHVLDTAIGSPAENVPVALFFKEEGTVANWQLLERSITNKDGRGALLTSQHLSTGMYKVHFDTQSYFSNHNISSFFYPYVEIVFKVDNTSQHYHIPLLLSPYGYSTYRGS